MAAPVHAVPVVASFDCQKAQNNYEKLVCKHRILGTSDIQMSKAYRETLILTPDRNEKNKIVEDQRKWLATIYAQLQKQIDDNESEEDIKNLLHRALLERGVTLVSNIKKEPGKVVILDNSSESKAVCSGILNENNITWEGRNDVGQDSFSLSPPSEYSSPEWEMSGIARYAKFDFMNSGNPTDTYLIDMDGTHIEFTNIIAATPQENKAIQDKLDDMDGFSNLTLELTQATPRTGKYPSPKFKSKLFDASGASIYAGWYTRSQIVQLNKVTYVITKSVNNLSGPTFVVFKPKTTGLDAICYYRAFPSIETKVVHQQNDKFKCPYKEKEIKYVLGDDKCSEKTTSIDLKEWGGLRPVVKKCTVYGHIAETTISVGGLNGSLSEQDLWQPLKKFAGGSKSLFSTAFGTYIANHSESGVTYYRITDNALTPTCTVENKITPHADYKVQHSLEGE